MRNCQKFCGLWHSRSSSDRLACSAMSPYFWWDVSGSVRLSLFFASWRWVLPLFGGQRIGVNLIHVAAGSFGLPPRSSASLGRSEQQALRRGRICKSHVCYLLPWLSDWITPSSHSPHSHLPTLSRRIETPRLLRILISLTKAFTTYLDVDVVWSVMDSIWFNALFAGRTQSRTPG